MSSAYLTERRKKRHAPTLALALVMVATPAHAALRSVDIHASGDGLATLDTERGFEWLDVTLNDGAPRAALEATGGGWFARRWRLAQRPEVETQWARFDSATQALSMGGSRLTYESIAANATLGRTRSSTGQECGEAARESRTSFTFP